MADLKVSMQLDGAGFTAGLNKSQKEVDTWSQGIRGQVEAAFALGQIKTKSTIFNPQNNKSQQSQYVDFWKDALTKKEAAHKASLARILAMETSGYQSLGSALEAGGAEGVGGGYGLGKGAKLAKGLKLSAKAAGSIGFAAAPEIAGPASFLAYSFRGLQTGMAALGVSLGPLAAALAALGIIAWSAKEGLSALAARAEARKTGIAADAGELALFKALTKFINNATTLTDAQKKQMQGELRGALGSSTFSSVSHGITDRLGKEAKDAAGLAEVQAKSEELFVSGMSDRQRAEYEAKKRFEDNKKAIEEMKGDSIDAENEKVRAYQLNRNAYNKEIGDIDSRFSKKGMDKGDSLVSVGNFLGSGRSAIESISKQQLDVSKRHLTASEKTNEILAKMQGSIIVPR